MNGDPVQRESALKKANRVRLGQAVIRREIASGKRSAAVTVLEDDPLIEAMRVLYVLTAQPRWGTTRARKVLMVAFAGRRNRPPHVVEDKRLRELTDRERRLLSAAIAEAAQQGRNGHTPTEGAGSG